MITGSVTEDGTPIIAVSVGGQAWQATIDTGFNSYLELPESMRALFQPQFLMEAIFFLAAGQRIVENVYEIDFPFDGQIIRANVTFVDSPDILIGTELLQDYRPEIDFPARTVHLEIVA